MKQKKHLCILVFAVLWLPQLLFAQKSEDFLKMKPDDWFEVLVSDTARKPNDESYRYNVRYLLKKVGGNGRKEYAVTFERIRVVFAPGKHMPLGYDSYYPPYKQGLSQKTEKPSFITEADQNGKILSIIPQGIFPKMELHEISSRKEYGGSAAEFEPIHEETAKYFSQLIITAISHAEKNWYNGQLYKDSKLSFLVVSASFTLQHNVWIAGKISNVNPQVRDGMSLYLPNSDQEFQIAKDGSFKLAAFITEGTAATLRYRFSMKSKGADQSYPVGVDVVMAAQEWEIPLFLRPGDSLDIHADGDQLINSLQFKGSAAPAAALGLALAKVVQYKKTPEISYSPTSFSAQDFMQAQESDRTNFLKVLRDRRALVSKESYQFHELRFTFEQANARLDFLSKTKYLSNPGAEGTFGGFPDRFFMAIDTLPVLMVDYTQANWYSSFLNSYKMYTIWKSGQYNGGTNGFFLGDYVLSLNYFRRFPLYSSLADAFENELSSNSWKAAQTLKPYYDDFINNCGDTSLTSVVKEKWQVLSAWAPGKLIPLEHIKLADGSILDLSKFKGKALSITFNHHYPDELKRLLERIKKQDAKNVHFLIVQVKENGFPPSNIAEEFKKLSQVTYVEISNENEELEDAVLLNTFDIKTFVLDPELQVVEDNIDDSPNKLPQDKAFEEAIQKALSPKKMSTEDKAELIKTIVWSLGSILFAGLLFFWIYKVRISSIKRKETLKRQIKELEIKAIRSQMNPHFMFNALNSIQSLINSHQYKEANVYLEKFSLLMRRVLNNSEKTFVSLSDELEAVTLYGELEKLRFDFVFSISIDKSINTDLIEIPGMIIQPLVENAILHGIAQKGTTGKLEIHISNGSKYLVIKVKDNGLGLKEDMDISPKTGFGIKLVRERLNLLNEQGADGKLNISPNLGENESGVTATLTIPID